MDGTAPSGQDGVRWPGLCRGIRRVLKIRNESTSQEVAEKSEGRKVALAKVVPSSQKSAENQECVNQPGGSRARPGKEAPSGQDGVKSPNSTK